MIVDAINLNLFRASMISFVSILLILFHVIDPIPTWLLKSCIVEFLPIIVKLINQSFATGHFLTLLKSAIVKPHLKKCTLNHDEIKNYRPVSKIQFIYKIIEKIVMKRIDEYLVSNNLYDPYN